MSRTRYKRRNLFIDKEFQGRIIFNYFLLVLLGSVLFMFAISFFSSNTLSIVYDNYHLELGLTPEIMIKKFFSAQWFFIVTGGGVIIIITLFLSHRVAGPFYRFEKTLEAMINGDLSQKIYLRKKDEGKELANKINQFNTTLSDKVVKTKICKNIVKGYIQEIEVDLSSSSDKNNIILEKLTKIKEELDKIDSLIDFVDLAKE